jgi:hypothetical protein
VTHAYVGREFFVVSVDAKETAMKAVALCRSSHHGVGSYQCRSLRITATPRREVKPLLRFQFLTAYHVGKTLEVSIPQILPPISEAERSVLRSRQVRNLCAHYGLRGAVQTAIGADDPFGAAVQSLTSVSRSEVEAVVNRWLRTVSDLLTARLSKSGLAHCRAWLGSHS